MPALGFLGFIGGAVAAYVIRCPRCRHFIGQLGFMGRARPLSLAKAVRYCPFCALDFDTELELVRTA
jgi:hypothetical protein